jgi:hypothetical protein
MFSFETGGDVINTIYVFIFIYLFTLTANGFSSGGSATTTHKETRNQPNK